MALRGVLLTLTRIPRKELTMYQVRDLTDAINAIEDMFDNLTTDKVAFDELATDFEEECKSLREENERLTDALANAEKRIIELERELDGAAD